MRKTLICTLRYLYGQFRYKVCLLKRYYSSDIFCTFFSSECMEKDKKIFFSTEDYSLKNLLFYRRLKILQVWNDMRVNKWQNIHFWVNYSFELLLNQEGKQKNLESDPWASYSFDYGDWFSFVFIYHFGDNHKKKEILRSKCVILTNTKNRIRFELGIANKSLKCQ